ncbi:MAG: hypothetical protein BWX98_00962 [Candidatus Aminicenantes bacterium ADurb.Bin147]|jgi:hypothetical protein|nr:MAG: hypothetical protein BWX98_00962 [Candidatus Aminicenantes bacterium ADurb.Bin147]
MRLSRRQVFALLLLTTVWTAVFIIRFVIL